MQIGVPGRVVIAAGPNLEVASHMWNARKVGCVAGRRRLSQNGSVVDAIEQAHAEGLTGPYPNRWRNAGPITVATIDEAEAVAVLTDFKLD
jgi:hypothetical protein